MIQSFGEKKEDITYTQRNGVHVVISRKEESEIVLVQAPNGAYFLPGGEIEANETHEDAIHRELLEELGFTAVIGEYFGQADEYFYSRNRDTYFYNPAYIYDVISWESVGERTEKKSIPVWFPVDVAIEKLKRGSHKWGVLEWKKRHGK
ncbi:8-oxo-dGTP diphosphatase [Pilibacter termitis]|jgi:8-oxo-dGTP diphosphatase|uniref:8-oxo-dGTP diphosphatase n=1 Tax=Pilibacter termitis TaxID=263852 RepID=A0A1T4LJ85_9ENTE|nr:NUDIX hydrolase [Pilibacter termitis]SJZ54789.1 8-oxo-dGTP diphosphatase [Pilibacter termitis]